MKNVYVVTFSGKDLQAICDGVWGVFTSLEKAGKFICHCWESYNETALDYDTDDFNGLWRYFTDKGTYQIEAIPLDDEGAI